MARKRDPDEVLKTWLERDLSEAAENDELPPAFEVDGHIRRISDALRSGLHPVLNGESGVGKTAVVYELLRRVHAGEGPEALKGRRVIQISLRHRAAALKEMDLMRPEMHHLINALIEKDREIVPFIRDIDFAWDCDVEPQLQSLAFRFRGPILAEGERTGTRIMFDATPELEQHYFQINVDEPNPEEMKLLLERWSAHQAESSGRIYDPESLNTALELTHRFLARDRLPRKAVDLLSQAGSVAGPDRPVTSAEVIDLFCRHFNVPRMLVDPSLSFSLSEVEELFQSRVLGQSEAVQAVVQLIGLIKAGLSDMRRPLAAFLFVGPTGVGKTHVAQLLAEYLFGSPERLLRFNMADYQHVRDAYVLFGDPEGHNVQARRGVLHRRLLGHPFAVTLLDEFEKAHRSVHDRFLQLMDEGCFINGAGETVSCRSLIFIGTSNTGAELYRGHAVGFSAPSDLKTLDSELDRRLVEEFRFEFLNRLDRVVHFHPLSRNDLRTIAMRELELIKERVGLKSRQLNLEVDEAVLDWLVAHGYDPNYGARFLRRAIERNVTTALAQTIVREEPPKGATLGLSVRSMRIAATVVSPTAESPDKRQPVRVPVGKQEKVRTLDRSTLLSETDRLLARARGPMEALAEKRSEQSKLLAEINAEGFWDDSIRARDVLERYRGLDVSTHVEGRFASALERLTDLMEEQAGHPKEADTKRLAQTYERAADAFRNWEERLAEEGPSAVWLLIRSADPLKPAESWINQLTSMELGWCRELHLRVSVVAYGLADETLSRVALEVEGPGASAYLQMEAGIHRLHRSQEASLRAQIDVIPVKAGPGQGPPAPPEIRRRAGRFNLDISCSGRIARADHGDALEFVAGDSDTLKHLLLDLKGYMASSRPDPETVRIYAEGGTGARDPRTGVVHPRLKSVLKGKLDSFLEGFRNLRSKQ